MSFSVTQVQFLQRLVRERPLQRLSSATARFFCEHYSLGTSIGRHIEYTADHHKLAQSLLRAHDLPLQALGPDASRADVAKYGGLSEKALSTAPHGKSVAVKLIGECAVKGKPLATPATSYLVVTPDLAGSISCDRLMLVENLETFRCLEDYRWLDFEGHSVMAVFRGDPRLPTGDALAVIRRRDEPIWAFVDFDPSGLVIANALPPRRLERLVLPGAQWLKQAADCSRGRQLFDAQFGQCSKALDDSQHPQIQMWWLQMREWQGGVTQERMLQASPRAARTSASRHMR
jgi:hypothetical protein